MPLAIEAFLSLVGSGGDEAGLGCMLACPGGISQVLRREEEMTLPMFCHLLPGRAGESAAVCACLESSSNWAPALPGNLWV